MNLASKFGVINFNKDGHSLFLRKIDISKLNAIDLFLKNVNDLETKDDCELKIYKCQLENMILIAIIIFQKRFV